MGNIDGAERLLVQRIIASLIDSPSVYMGGPSPASMKKADRIIAELEQSYRIHHTKCGHGTWRSYREHGTYCPTCGTLLNKSPDDRPSSNQNEGQE